MRTGQARTPRAGVHGHTGPRIPVVVVVVVVVVIIVCNHRLSSRPRSRNVFGAQQRTARAVFTNFIIGVSLPARRRKPPPRRSRPRKRKRVSLSLSLVLYHLFLRRRLLTQCMTSTSPLVRFLDRCLLTVDADRCAGSGLKGFCRGSSSRGGAAGHCLSAAGPASLFLIHNAFYLR